MLKKIATYSIIIVGVILSILLFILIAFILGISSCVYVYESLYEEQEKVYYSNEAYFITGTGTVVNMSYGEDFGLTLDEIDDRYQDVNFIIEGKNADIVKKNNIAEKINIGDEIQFTSAPGYFGDGYIMPIIAISVNGEELLSYEEGYKNLMAEYK